MTQTPFIPESRILRARASTATNSDDWPEFELHQARVASLTGELVSLLQAGEHYPVTVTGTLQPLTSRLSHLYQPNAGGTRTVNIELKEVRLFAYGEYANGNIVIWAAGQAGWFAVTPSRGYRTMYNEMRDAVKVLYFIADAYRGSPSQSTPSGGKMSAQELFERYAAKVLENPGATSEAAEAIYRHRDFLFASMLAGKEGMAWSSNPLNLHMQRKFPLDYSAVRERLATAPVKGKGSKASSDADSTTSSLKRKRTRSLKGQDVEVMSVASTATSSRRGGRTRGTTQQNAAPTQTTRHSSRASVVSSPLPNTPALINPVTPLQKESEDEDDSSDTTDGDTAPPGQVRARKGQSALRPKAGKASKGRKGPAGSQKQDSEDELATDQIPSPTSRKRKSESQAVPQRRSRRHMSAEDVATIDEEEEEEEEEEETSSASHSPSSSTSDDQATSMTTILPHHLKNARDPIQDDTFLCPLPPCSHRIYSVTTPLAQRLIKEHLTSHQTTVEDDDQRIQLVRKLQAPSLPAGRLLEKVLSAAAGRATMGGPGLLAGSHVAGTRFPAAAGPVGQGVVVRY